jgi:hypothetical protein
MKETLEEAAESRYGTDIGSIRGGNVYDLNTDLKRGFIEGAKWQMERMKAREVESSIVKQLLDETTPKELSKIDKQMSNKKTTVEWLQETLESFGNKHELQVSWTTVDELFEQAKEMEKEQIIDAYNNADSVDENNIGWKSAEQYYNETFGQQEQ